MNKKDFRKFVIEEVRKIMAERPEKYSSFANDFNIRDERRKEIVWKKNKNVYINDKGIRYLMQSLNAITKTKTKSVGGHVNMKDYNKDKDTMDYNGVIVPVDIIRQLERVWVHEFGPY